MTASRRAGAALLAVVVALALLGTLATAGAFATMLRIHADHERSRAPAAEALAESLAVATLEDWGGAVAARLAAGDTIDSLLAVGQVTARLRIVPLRRGRYVLTANVESHAPAGARAGVWLAARRDSTFVGSLAAITSAGPFALLDASTAASDDRPPTDSLGCPPADSIARAIDVASTPPPLANSLDALGRHAELRLGRRGAGVDVTPAPRSAGARCDASDLANWGDPDAAIPPCALYSPVIAVDGTLSVHGGRGQGVLLVGGDLELRGEARFVGLVVVRGRATLTDDARIVGALVVLDSAGAGSAAHDRATVQRSSCAVARALAATGPPHPDGAHAWAPLY